MNVAAAIALVSGSRAAVTGFVLLVSGRPPVLCAELLESMPPQCGGARIELVGLTGGSLPVLHESDGVRWTAGAVTLSGIMRDGRLHLAS